MLRNVLLITSILLLYTSVYAEQSQNGVSSNTQVSSAQTNKINVGNCSPSTTQSDLDINNIRARILGGGDFWWDGVDLARYEYPKTDQSSNAIPVNAIFAGALWFSGEDDGGNLKIAAQTYRNQGHDFWTGPLDVVAGEVGFATCNAFDQHFVVYGQEIDQFLGDYIAGNNNILESDIPDNVKFWPGKGNPFLSGSDLFYSDGPLAPFYDNNGDGIYTPQFGDYPVIGVTAEDPTSMTDTVVPTYADQMIFWVINDNGQIHGRTGGEAIGVQVNCLAFAYQTSDELNDMTFYTYEIVKRSPGNLFQTYMGVFVDPDLGDFDDDYIGCDTIREMGFVYNANAVDAQYGINPPIIGFDFFEGPIADDGSELGMSSFVYFNRVGNAQSDPDVAPEFRNYQTGKWKDETPIQFGGNGYNTGNSSTNYVYPGNPEFCTTPLNWSERNADNPVSGGCVSQPPSDRRFVQNSGPFTLEPGEFQRITIGVIAVQPENYDGSPDIELELGTADDLAQSLFDNGFQLIDGPDAPIVKIRELANELILSLVNEPSSNNVGENYIQAAPLPDNGLTYEDSTYLFQGYKVYQLENASVTAQELDNPEKAQLIFQADIKDDIADIYNYEASPTGFYNSVLQVQGSNEGITRSFKVTDDQFAEGDRALVNNKTYYFAAVAYAYNNFIPFEYPVPTPLPQFEPYLQGRKNFKVYSAIPHVIDSRSGGTVLNAQFGQPIEVQRLEGQGNGGVAIQLNRATEEAIVNSVLYFKDVLTYELGKDPLNVKVTDPLLLKNVDFQLSFKGADAMGNSVNHLDENAYWELEVSENGQVIETIVSERKLTRQYEQLIEDYGISLSVGVPEVGGSNLLNNEAVYKPITSNVTHLDLSDLWLSFVPDEGFNSPKNWIRGGQEDEDLLYYANVYDSHQYDELTGANGESFYDIDNLFGGLIDGGMAPYCMASNYANPNVPVVQGELSPDYLYGPAFRWEVYDVGGVTEVKNPINTLEHLSSIEVVITPDETLWSECIVFETGEKDLLNVGNAPKGWLRDDYSKNVAGIEYDLSEKGKSVFPGYAINTETGERLNISFGESSAYGNNNGNDMLWNPTSKLYDELTNISGTEEKVPVWGGKHFIYVWKTRYDGGEVAHDILSNATFNNIIPTEVGELYKDIMYTGIPVLALGSLLNTNGQVEIPSEVRLSINIERPFKALYTAETSGVGSNDSLPRYGFSTMGMAPDENVSEVAESALDDIRVVPNPYYAFSAYEASQIDNVVKLTNLPDRCVVSIFTLDGKLVRKFDRAVGNSTASNITRQEISSGQVVGSINLDNSINWDLNNEERIPVGSGTYLIHIDAPGVGETVVKSVVFLRPTDVSSF